MGTLDAAVTLPYWSTVTCETFALEPYVPAVAPLVGKLPTEIVPTRLLEFKFEIPEPLETTSKPCTLRPVSVPTEVMFGWAGVVTLAAVPTVPTRLLEFKLEIAEPLETTSKP